EAKLRQLAAGEIRDVPLLRGGTENGELEPDAVPEAVVVIAGDRQVARLAEEDRAERAAVVLPDEPLARPLPEHGYLRFPGPQIVARDGNVGGIGLRDRLIRSQRAGVVPVEALADEPFTGPRP